MLPSLKFVRCILNFQHHVVYVRLFSQSSKLSLVFNKPKCLFSAIGMPNTSLEFYQAPCRQCCWTLLVKTMAGHSKWQNIRHIKAAKDQQKSDLAFKFSQRIRILIKGRLFFFLSTALFFSQVKCFNVSQDCIRAHH